MGDDGDIEHELREAASCAYVDGGQLMYCMTQTELLKAADTIARLRADLAEALGALKPFLSPGEYSPSFEPYTWEHAAMIERARKILASHKENTDG